MFTNQTQFFTSRNKKQGSKMTSIDIVKFWDFALNNILSLKIVQMF